MIRILFLFLLIPLSVFAETDDDKEPPFLTIDEARDYYSKQIESAPEKINGYFSKFSDEELNKQKELKDFANIDLQRSAFIPVNSDASAAILGSMMNENKKHSLREFRDAFLKIAEISKETLPKLNSSICDDENSTICQDAIRTVKYLRHYGFDSGNVTYTLLDKDTFQGKYITSAVSSDLYKSLEMWRPERSGQWLSFVILSRSKVKFDAKDIVADEKQDSVIEGKVNDAVNSIINISFGDGDSISPCNESLDLLREATQSLEKLNIQFPNGTAKRIYESRYSPKRSLLKCEKLIYYTCRNMYPVDKESLALSYITSACKVRDIVKEDIDQDLKKLEYSYNITELARKQHRQLRAEIVACEAARKAGYFTWKYEKPSFNDYGCANKKPKTQKKKS